MNLRAFGTSARAERGRRARVNRWLFLRRIARRTFHMSPADLERVVRMAGILATDRRGLRHLPPPPRSEPALVPSKTRQPAMRPRTKAASR